MQRLPTTFALASWIGFVSTSALVPLLRDDRVASASSGGDALAAGAASMADMPLAADGILPLIVAGLFGAALALVHGDSRERRRLGERLGLTGLGLLAVIAAFGWLDGARPFGVETFGGTFFVLIALSMAAVLFDRGVAVESEDDTEAFEAGISAIAQSMACQTHLYAERSLRDVEGQGR